MIASLDLDARTNAAQWKILKDLKKGKLGKPGRIVPKQENLITVESFRTILLVSVEEKVFFSILSKWLTKYLLKKE